MPSRSAVPNLGNDILFALPSPEQRRLDKLLETVPLRSDQVLLKAGEPISFVYFPLSGVLAKLVQMSDRSTAEVGMIGKEGMAPVSWFFASQTAHVHVVVQNAGNALRMSAEAFTAEVNTCSPLRQAMLHFCGGYFRQIVLTAACHQLHSVAKRYCRWLLMTQDRLGSDEFPLMQEWVGKVLGVRRMSISPAARALQQAGIIRYRRGRVQVLDRLGLEARACECYRRIVGKDE